MSCRELAALSSISIINCATGVTFVLIEVIGNTLLLGISGYERFHGDPMKRTLFNQLLSLFCIAMIIVNVVSVPFFTARVLFGPLGHFATILFFFTSSVAVLMKLMILNEMVIFYFLLAFFKRRMSLLNDHFWATYVTMLNCLFCSLITLERLIRGDHSHSFFYEFLSGIQIVKKSKPPL
jgi:hypothetical protein